MSQTWLFQIREGAPGPVREAVFSPHSVDFSNTAGDSTKAEGSPHPIRRRPSLPAQT